MFTSSTLLVALLAVGFCRAGPTKTSDEVPVQNEVTAESLNADAKTKSGELAAGEVPSPLISPPKIILAENEDTFAGVSGFGEGHFLNEEYGYAGKGVAAGLAGGVVNDKGVTAGGAGYAAGIAGVDTKPFKGFVSLNTEGQGTINNYGEKAQPFKLEVNEDAETPNVADTVPSPVKVETKPSEEKSPTVVGIPTVSNTIGALFRPNHPLSPPALFNTLTSGIFHGALADKSAADPISDKQNVPRDEESETAEEESGFYSFIRPLTPSGIAANVATILRPLTTISGQAQGSITLTGGASYTGNPPHQEKPVHHDKPHHEKPHHEESHHEKPHYDKPPHHEDKPPHHEEKPSHHVKPEGQSPCGKPPQHDNSKVQECKAVCEKNGKAGGSLTPGGCCSCSCPVPEVHFGELCCSGSDEACNSRCKQNPNHKYSSGSCNPHTKACECRCSPWEPWWVPDVEEVVATHQELHLIQNK